MKEVILPQIRPPTTRSTPYDDHTRQADIREIMSMVYVSIKGQAHTGLKISQKLFHCILE